MTEHNWLAREVTELADVNDSLIDTARGEGRDMTEGESEIINRNSARLKELQTQLGTIQQAQSIRSQSLESLAMLGSAIESGRQVENEYQTAGEYIVDMWRAGAGVPDAEQRISRYLKRVAAHNITSDAPGIVPDPVVGPLVNFIDDSRPVLQFIGVQPLTAGPTFYYPKVTQHTSVGAQATEKTELVSQKMTITKTAVTVATLGGYVNVSRQLIDWSSPDAFQIIVNDLASQYAVQTENRAVDAFVAGATAGGGSIPADGNVAGIVGAVWGAAAKVYAATKGAGQVFLGVGPDLAAKIAPAFAPYNPTNAQGIGFSAGTFASGIIGTVSGVPVVMSPAFDTGKGIVASTAAVRAYEQRVGQLQVIEPSVLGVQVAYAGYFAQVIVEPGGVQAIIQGV